MKIAKPEQPFKPKLSAKAIDLLVGHVLSHTTPIAVIASIASEVLDTAALCPDELGFVERQLLDPVEEMCRCIRADIEKMRAERTEH